MQSVAAFSKEIKEEDIYSLASVVKPKELDEALNFAIKHEFVKSRDTLFKIMLNYGLSGLDMIKQIQREVLKLNIDDRDKVRIIDKCGEIEFRMVEGSDSFIQLESLMAFISYLVK